MTINRRKLLAFGAVATGTTVLDSKSYAEIKPSLPSQGRGYDYKRPDFPKGSRLLFQGDSITDMKWGRNENDRNHYLGHSYVFLIAGRLGMDMPKAKLAFFNRGISGNKVSDLKARWQKDAINLKPDLLSILVGTNDVGMGFRHPGKAVTPGAFERDYRQIIEASLKANPKLRIVLLDPFILQSGRLKDQQAYSSRRKETDKMRVVVTKLAKDYQAAHLQTQELFDQAASEIGAENWIWDGIHPLPQGHELIARHWLDIVATRWPKA